MGSECRTDFKANTTNIQKRKWRLKRQKGKWAGKQGAGDEGRGSCPPLLSFHLPCWSLAFILTCTSGDLVSM